MSDKGGGGVGTPDNEKGIPPFSEAERKTAESNPESATAASEELAQFFKGLTLEKLKRFIEDERETAKSNPESDAAPKEHKKLSGDRTRKQLKEDAKKDELKRSKVFRDHFENIAICTLYLVSFVLGVIMLVWLIHLLTPQSLHWLSGEQIYTLQTILTGGALVGIASRHFKKRLDD